MKSSSLRKWILRLFRTERYAATRFPAKRKTTLISRFSGSSSTQNPGGAETAGVVLQLCLPCYIYATPPSLCDDVQSPTHMLHCYAHVTLFPTFTLLFFHKPWECTTTNAILIPNLSNAVGIIHDVKLFPLTWSKNLFLICLFSIQALTSWSNPVVYNASRGYTATQVLKEGWFCQTGLS